MCNLILIWNMAHIFAHNLIKWRKSACESVDLNNNALLVWVVSVPLHFSTCECHNQVIKPFTCLLSKKMWKSYVWTSVMFKRTEVSYLSVAKRIGEEKEKKNIYRLRLLHYEWVWPHEFQWWLSLPFSSPFERKLCWYSNKNDNDDDDNEKLWLVQKKQCLSVRDFVKVI